MWSYFGSTSWFPNRRPLVECSHREVCRYDWLFSQGFSTICDVNCCPLQVIFEFVYCWNPLNPQITGGWKKCDCHCAAATVEFQSFCWSLTFSCSQHDDLYTFFWPFFLLIASVLFPHLIISPLEAGRESEWNFLPQNQCLKKDLLRFH